MARLDRDVQDLIQARVAEIRALGVPLPATDDLDPLAAAVAYEQKYVEVQDKLKEEKLASERQFAEGLSSLKTQIAALRPAAAVERDAMVRVAITSPTESGGGFLGVDRLSGQSVYVETSRSRPRAIAQTLALGPLEGMFNKTGKTTVRNAAGNTIEVLKLVDAKDDVQRALAESEKLESDLSAQARSAERRMAEFEPVPESVQESVSSRLRGLLAAGASGDKFAAAVGEAANVNEQQTREARHQAASDLDSLQARLQGALAGCPLLRRDVLGHATIVERISDFDAKRAAYAAGRGESVANATRKVLAGWDASMGRTMLVGSLMPKWAIPDEDSLLIVGTDMKAGVATLVLVRDGMVIGQLALPTGLDPTDRLRLFRVRGRYFVRFNGGTFVCDAALRLISRMDNVWSDDVLDTGTDIAISGALAGQTALWSLADDSRQLKLVQESTKPGLMKLGKQIVCVSTTQEGAGLQEHAVDHVQVRDWDASKTKSDALAPTLKRINQTAAAEAGNGWHIIPPPSFQISQGKLWVFAAGGIRELSTGATLVSIGGDGEYSTPLFALARRSDQLGPQRDAATQVTAGAMYVEAAVLGRRGTIIAGEMPAAMSDELFTCIAALRYDGGAELWSEKSPHPWFDEIKTVVSRHAEATRDAIDPPTHFAAPTASLRVQRYVLGQEKLPLARIDEFALSAGEWKSAVFGAEPKNEKDRSDGSVQLPAFAHKGWVYFGEGKLEALPVK